MPHKIYLPPKYHIPILEDPINYYYIPVFRSFFIKRLELTLSFVTGQRLGKVLDIGCGTGALFPEFFRRADLVAGIDTFIQDYSIRGLCQMEKVTAYIAWGSVLDIPFKGQSFDTITCISTLEHISDSVRALKDIKRTLKTGGRLLAGFPTRNAITAALLGESTGFHVASHRQILKAAEEVFGKIQIKHFPAWLPLDLSLYTAFHGRK